MSGVLENRSGHSTDSSLADKNGARVVFNEQTNYVPKRTIITVSLAAENSLQYLIMLDLFGVFQRRFAGSDGPDHAGVQFVHHRQCPRC